MCTTISTCCTRSVQHDTFTRLGTSRTRTDARSIQAKSEVQENECVHKEMDS